MKRYLIDTNILLRLMLGDHPDHSPLTERFFARINRHEIEGYLPTTAIFEAIYVLENSGVSQHDISAAFVELFSLSGLFVLEHEVVTSTFDLYVQHAKLSFADCYHAALTMRGGFDGIASFDRGFDRVEQLSRYEPSASSEDAAS